MIKREFQDTEGAKSVGSSHGDFCFVVEPLDDTAGILLSGLEVVEQEDAVSAQGTGDRLHRFDTGMPLAA